MAEKVQRDFRIKEQLMIKLQDAQPPYSKAQQYYHNAALKAAKEWYNSQTFREQMYIDNKYKELSKHKQTIGNVFNPVYLEMCKELNAYLPNNITVNQLKEAVGL